MQAVGTFFNFVGAFVTVAGAGVAAVVRLCRVHLEGQLFRRGTGRGPVSTILFLQAAVLLFQVDDFGVGKEACRKGSLKIKWSALLRTKRVFIGGFHLWNQGQEVVVQVLVALEKLGGKSR